MISDRKEQESQSRPRGKRMLQRKCACGGSADSESECTDCKKKKLQRRATSSSPDEAPAIVHDVLRSPGQPLETSTRAFFEPRLGHDFNKVRVHTDERAARSAQSVHALAYTVGSDVVFETRQYVPESAFGRELLAHELAHTVQQGYQNPSDGPLPIVPARDALEQEAKRVARGVVSPGHFAGQRIAGFARQSPVLQRYEAGEHAEFGETGPELTAAVEEGRKEKSFVYKVKPGETPKRIAAKFHITEDELLEFNRPRVTHWRANADPKKKVTGFNAGAVVHVPPVLNDATKNALKSNELTLTVNGVAMKYGEGIAMGDLYESAEQMMSPLPSPASPKFTTAAMSKTAKQSELQELSRLIEVDKAEREKQRQGKAGTPVSDEQWQRATHERYLDLAAANESHFAPSNTALAASSGKSVTDNKAEWEKNHKSALEKSQTGDMDQALAVNSFADHFLTDAFSAGHLFNKRDVMEAFAGKLPKNAKGDEFTAGSKVFFDKVAHQAFTGAVKDEFSKFETVEFKGVIFRPNIDSESRFSALLQGIQMEKPELLESAIAKAVHDTLNKEGVPVENDKGESWPLLSGDGKLNEKTLAFGRKAVAQSQLNVLDVFKRVVTLDLPALFKKVWAYVPRPTKEGQELIKKEVASGTDPRSASLIAAVVKLIKDNFKLIIDGLVKLGKLKKA